jgi:hypothetical protein
LDRYARAISRGGGVDAVATAEESAPRLSIEGLFFFLKRGGWFF